MRKGVLQRIASRLLWFTVAALSVPFAVAVAAGEPTWYAWPIAAALAALLAGGLQRLPEAVRAPPRSLRRREGFVAVTLGWLTLVFFTALAYHVTGVFDGFAYAFFESMSGYTTTGATVARDVEALPASVLFMRAFSQWIGGMGIIVLTVAILPELAVGGMQLLSAESSGLETDKLAPRIAATARRLWGLYVGLTAALALLLLPAGLSVFDAVAHAMATIATAGFSTKNASIAHFDSVYVELVILVFMFVSGISFSLQYRAIVQRQPQRLLRSPEVRLYAAITAAAIALVTIDIYGTSPELSSVGSALRHASFQGVSIVSTTAFTTRDFDTWPDFSRLVLVVLMVTGACAGSTAGGFKMIRVHVVIKHAGMQLRRLVRPRLAQTLELGGRQVARDATEGVLGFLLLYVTAIVVGALGMTALGLDLVSGVTASVAMLNSVGSGLGDLGAVEPYADVPVPGLYLLSFGMLLGRLEIYPVLVLLTPHFWRRG